MTGAAAGGVAGRIGDRIGPVRLRVRSLHAHFLRHPDAGAVAGVLFAVAGRAGRRVGPVLSRLRRVLTTCFTCDPN